MYLIEQYKIKDMQNKKEQLYKELIIQLYEDGQDITPIIRKIARDTDLLTFEERLSNSKEQDLY